MSSDGKQLESLVAFVEKTLLPDGFTVKSNARVMNDEGVQIAEFDIEVQGKVGSTSISWLIECRDRPGQGAAPGSWIEQLVGRRTRFGFNKVTAVSTTGFAAGAAAFAAEQGIELRVVKNLDSSEFSDWLHISSMRQIRRVSDLKHAKLLVSPNEPDELREAAREMVARASGNEPILRSSTTGEKSNLSQAFFAAVQSTESPFDGLGVGGSMMVSLVASYDDNDHFIFDTALGSVKVGQIEFLGELRIEESLHPLVQTSEYRHAATGEPISQLASFAPQTILGMKYAFELHRMTETGVTHVTMRRLRDDA